MENATTDPPPGVSHSYHRPDGRDRTLGEEKAKGDLSGRKDELRSRLTTAPNG
jgi:hypothetical protein